MLQGRAQLARCDDQSPKLDRGSCGALRLDVRLAEVVGQADAEDHHGDADGDRIDPRPIADTACRRPSTGPDARRPPDTPSQGRAGLVADGVAGHRAHDQRAFQAEVDAARFLGDAFAQADDKNGVPTRMAPPKTAIATAQQAQFNRLAHSWGGYLHGWAACRWSRFVVAWPERWRLEQSEASIEGFEQQDHHEHNAHRRPPPTRRARSSSAATRRRKRSGRRTGPPAE